MSTLKNRYRLTNMLIISLVILLLQLAQSSNATFSHYGEMCDDILSCDQSAALTCVGGTCGCNNTEEVIFEESTQKCRTRAGAYCDYDQQYFYGNNQTYNETIDCVENAFCHYRGYCSCFSNYYYENPNGTCSPRSSLLEPCDENVQCQLSGGLECQNNTCQCNSTAAIFSAEENQCVGLAGQECINSRCTENATCKIYYSCECDPDYFADSHGKCTPKVGLGGACSSNGQCTSGKGLTCVQGVCACDPESSAYGTSRVSTAGYYSYAFYGYEGPNRTQCLGKVNHPCKDKLCVPNAFCEYQYRYATYGYCRCPSGMVMDANSTHCGVPYNNGCSATLKCLNGFVCNETAGRCSCRYEDQIYDKNTLRCQSKVGGPCSDDMFCVSGTKCDKFLNSPHGVCSCQTGYIANPERLCELEYGQPCNKTSTSCDSLAGLDCIDEVCQCRKFGRYSPENRTCLGFVGTACSRSMYGASQCIENAKCSSNFYGLQATCNCKAGFVPTENYTCEPKEQNNSKP